MANNLRLGKGLGALLGDSVYDAPKQSAEAKVAEDRVLHVGPHLLDPNPYQPRVDFDEAALEELTQSISLHGILQPLLVTKGESDRYTIIAGERRWRAARKAGLTTVPVIVKDFDDRQLMEAALIENLQRTDLNPVEEAEAISVLMGKYGLTQEIVSSRIGKSRSTVANALRILSLPEPVLQLVRDGKLTSGHARAVLMAPGHLQQTLSDRIIAQGLSVRQAEKLAQSYKQPPTVEPEKPVVQDIDPHIKSAENQLSQRFGTRVLLSGDLSKGRISIEYYSREDLDRIYELLISQ